MDKKYILVAEDEKAVARVYQQKLENAGFEVKCVEDGNGVMEELKKRKPDLLVLDLVMPEKDGFSVLADMRRSPEYKDIRVVVATNLSQDTDRRKVEQYGIMDYFTKSNVSVSQLVEKITKALE